MRNLSSELYPRRFAETVFKPLPDLTPKLSKLIGIQFFAAKYFRHKCVCIPHLSRNNARPIVGRQTKSHFHTKVFEQET